MHCNISELVIDDGDLEFLFKYSYFMETKFDFQINSESKLSIFNSYFINCNVESLDVDIIRDCYFKNSTIVSITGHIETVFTDNATSVINCSFTQEIPYPEVEPIL